MPRQARIDAPGALHHIIARGIEKRLIFRDNRDRIKFIDRLGDILLETETPCYAWALMPNHIHILLRTGTVPITKIMRRLMTGHAVYFNLRHSRHGHLFQNRFKSILCQEDLYLLELVRYIHLNPLRGNRVSNLKSLDRHRFCGHGALIGKYHYEWQDIDYVLQFFAKKQSAARRRYRGFVEKGIDQGRRPDLVGGGLLRSVGGWSALKALNRARERIKGDERILGDSDFVIRCLKKAEEDFNRRYRLKKEGYDLGRIAHRVSEILGIDADDIWRHGKQPLRVKARSLVCFWAHYERGIQMTALASKL
jgi:REP element-mobilizing transposase RayT